MFVSLIVCVGVGELEGENWSEREIKKAYRKTRAKKKNQPRRIIKMKVDG